MAATNLEIWQRGTVVEATEIASGIRRIVLSTELPMKPAPGTHIDVRVHIDGLEAKRSYSVVESSQDGGSLVISVLKAPLSRGGSEFMHSLKEGDQLEITQPLQNFPLRIGANSYVLLAGGIGITAIMSMARVLKNLGMRYTFVYVGRSRSAMAYLQELEQLHGERLIVHIDDEGSTLDVDQLIGRTEPDTELYVCGPIRLMDAVRRSWNQHGRNYPNLRYETFGNSGWHDPEEFIVRVPARGLEVRVGRDRSMLETLEDAGLDMMSDCRRGECGLCEVRITGLEGSIDHRDVFYSARQKDSKAKMACCVSRAVIPTEDSVIKTADSLAVVTIEIT